MLSRRFSGKRCFRNACHVRLTDADTVQHFMDKYNPTISNTLHTQTTHKGQKYELEIVDTAGQDEHSIWHAQQAIGVDGFIMVYSGSWRSLFLVAVCVLCALCVERVGCFVAQL